MDCTLCKQKFDKDKRIPHVLKCGHTFCFCCLSSLEVKHTIKCPLCENQQITEKISDIPKNFSVLSFIDSNEAKTKQTSDEYFENYKHIIIEIQKDKISKTLSKLDETNKRLMLITEALGGLKVAVSDFEKVSKECSKKMELADKNKKILDSANDSLDKCKDHDAFNEQLKMLEEVMKASLFAPPDVANMINLTLKIPAVANATISKMLGKTKLYLHCEVDGKDHYANMTFEEKNIWVHHFTPTKPDDGVIIKNTEILETLFSCQNVRFTGVSGLGVLTIDVILTPQLTSTAETKKFIQMFLKLRENDDRLILSNGCLRILPKEKLNEPTQIGFSFGSPHPQLAHDKYIFVNSLNLAVLGGALGDVGKASLFDAGRSTNAGVFISIERKPNILGFFSKNLNDLSPWDRWTSWNLSVLLKF